MNNLEQGSAGTSLAQNAHISQDLSPQTTLFLAQAQAAIVARQEAEAQPLPPQAAPSPSMSLRFMARAQAALTANYNAEANSTSTETVLNPEKSSLANPSVELVCKVYEGIIPADAGRAISQEQPNAPADDAWLYELELYDDESTLQEALVQPQQAQKPTKPTPARKYGRNIRKDDSGPRKLLGDNFDKYAQPKARFQGPLPLEALLDLESLKPKRGKGAGTEGAVALARLLDHLARIALDARIYLYEEDGTPPAQIVMHQPAEAIAEALGVSDDTYRRYVALLTEKGYIQARAHVTSTTEEGNRVDRMDGTLYAVRLAPGHTAKLTRRDYKRQYRDLDADRAAGRTAYNLINNAYSKAEEKPRQDEKNKCGGQKGHHESYEVIKARLCGERMTLARKLITEGLELWAVTPGFFTQQQTPVTNNDPRIYFANITAGLKTVQDVIYSVEILADCAYKIRSDLLAAFARILSRDFDNYHNHPAWCGLLWEAYRREKAGLHGLDSLRRVLTRIMVAHRERGKDIRSPGAMCFKAWRNEVGGLTASELASAAD